MPVIDDIDGTGDPEFDILDPVPTDPGCGVTGDENTGVGEPATEDAGLDIAEPNLDSKSDLSDFADPNLDKVEADDPLDPSDIADPTLDPGSEPDAVPNLDTGGAVVDADDPLDSDSINGIPVGIGVSETGIE